MGLRIKGLGGSGGGTTITPAKMATLPIVYMDEQYNAKILYPGQTEQTFYNNPNAPLQSFLINATYDFSGENATDRTKAIPVFLSSILPDISGGGDCYYTYVGHYSYQWPETGDAYYVQLQVAVTNRPEENFSNIQVYYNDIGMNS